MNAAAQDHPFLSSVCGVTRFNEIDLTPGIEKVFPGVELRKAETITADESLAGLARKLLKKLSNGSSDAERVHEPSAQWKVGQTVRYGSCDVTVIDVGPKTFTLRLPSGDKAVVPASVVDTLQSPDPSAFNFAVSTMSQPYASFQELAEHSLSSEGDWLGTVKP